jgi:signal transduction histidine kinase
MVSPAGFPAEGGEMGRLIRSFDWASTPLGPIQAWPQSLRTAVNICVDSGFPVLLWWGPELAMIYNDAYRLILGDKHPRSMGQAGRECWPEIWNTIGPMLLDVLKHGRTSYFEDLMLPLQRRGFAEECYFTFSYSPIRDDSDRVSGVFCAVTETTERVYGERQLAFLRNLAAGTADARTLDEASAMAMACLTNNPWDLPFTALYLDEGDQGYARVGFSGLAAGHEAALPLRLSAADTAASPWRLAEVARTKLSVIVDIPVSLKLAGDFRPQPRQALVVPIVSNGGAKTGMLLAGLNPMRPLNEQYRGFVDLAAGQIAASIGNAYAYEQQSKRAEALAEINRAKTVFFSNVSHEFRTPLTLMMGPLEDLLQKELPPAEREELAMVHRNAMRLLKLVNTMLDFAGIEAARMRATFQPTNLATFTADLASTFRSAMEKANLRLRIDCPPLPQPVYVDRAMWEKIVLNLLSNAFKFTLQGEIAVALCPGRDCVELQVRDTGVGIPQDQLPKVFERFHRVPGVRGRTHEGTGIGLALTKELVGLHAGSITADSTPGRGTTFTVRIPTSGSHLPGADVGSTTNAAAAEVPSALLDAQPGAQPSAQPYLEEALRWLPDVDIDTGPAKREDHAHRARVLLADDNADMRQYLQQLLGQFWTVESVADGVAALAACTRDPPDLVLTDVMMPGMDGFQLLDRLRADATLKEIPVIVLSARAGEDARVEGVEAGADDYVVKPFAARELVARVRAHLRLARMRREVAQALASDIAERKQTEEDLLRAKRDLEEVDRRKNHFLAVLSHELRNPLTPVRNSLFILDRAAPGSAQALHAREVIRRQFDLLTHLVDDLLDVTRITSGKIHLQRGPVELVEVVKRTVEDHRSLFEKAQIEVQLKATTAQVRIEADGNRIAQVISNLLLNAAKFTPRGGRVEVQVSTDAAAGQALVRVTDNGAGIQPDMLSRLFQPFMQADEAIDRSKGGLGLGLALVKGLVEQHGGTVAAASDGLGCGSQFTVRLPLGGAEPRAAEPQQRPAVKVHRRVLVIEDNVDAADSMREILELEGHEVAVAYDGPKGLASAREFRPEVVICDVGLPGMDGYEVARSFRRDGALKDACMVALSGYALSEDRQRAAEAGFDHHLAKPVDLNRLEIILRATPLR